MARRCKYDAIRSRVRRGFAAALVVFLLSGAAVAAPPPVSLPTDTAEFGASSARGPFGFLAGVGRSNYLLGDMWGLRTLLSRAGIAFGLQETSEILGNVTGGTSHGFEYDGLTQMVLQMDTQRAFGWYGGTFNASALQIHGRNLSTDRLATLQTASGIEADRATRLWELWYQQKFLDEDRLDVKIGQQSLDQEFMVSQNALMFVNTMFGWPMLPSADLPGGGPAYPLSALGVRLRARPVDSLAFLLGVFNGTPVSNPAGDPQRSNASGTSFPTRGGTLAIAELQYSYPSLGTMVSADETEPLSRLYKIGLWYDSARFDDQRLDDAGLSLADPASSGTPRRHRGDFAIYAVADQMIWRSFTEPDRTINVFVRAMGTPLGDRNVIVASLNAGITIHEPFLHRDSDTFGIGMGFAKVSNNAAALDRDTGFFNGGFVPVRNSETFIEATYQYQVAPWWQLQPDVQYLFDPGGGVANPNNPGQYVHNELVVGLRTNILF
ncbi:MAG: oprB [Pseudonocardiales bacterium]|nr:oprB [Pseudonocardiales bacterium]